MAFFHYTGLLAGVDITIQKHVPVRAGMAGGSADAAGVLVGLNELYNAQLSMSELCAIGAGIGRSDESPAALPGLLVCGGYAQRWHLHTGGVQAL